MDNNKTIQIVNTNDVCEIMYGVMGERINVRCIRLYSGRTYFDPIDNFMIIQMFGRVFIKSDNSLTINFMHRNVRVRKLSCNGVMTLVNCTRLTVRTVLKLFQRNEIDLVFVNSDIDDVMLDELGYRYCDEFDKNSIE